MLRKAYEKGFSEEFKEIDVDLLENTVDFLTDYLKYLIDRDVPDKIMSYSATNGLQILK